MCLQRFDTLQVFFSFSAWTHCTECTNENKEEILKVCQSSASKLDEAEHLKNASLVCRLDIITDILVLSASKVFDKKKTFQYQIEYQI